MLSKTAQKQYESYFNKLNPLHKAAMFPKLYEIEKLPINNKLKPLRIISLQKRSAKGSLSVKFKVEPIYNSVNVYFYVNGHKKDMYYSVPAGIYKFNARNLKNVKNVLELFYVHNGFKSKTLSLKVTTWENERLKDKRKVFVRNLEKSRVR